jgi:hypothetical protein
VFNGRTAAPLTSFFAAASTGGVRVAAGDVNGDGRADIITGLGPGGDNKVRVFDGPSGTSLATFATYDASSTGGIFVATAAPENRSVIDAPASGAILGDHFTVAGWAIQDNAAGGTGVDAIHIYAHPVSGQPPIFLGAAVMGDARPDVAAVFGAEHSNAGYHLAVNGLAEGVYDLRTYAHDAASGLFNTVRTTRVTVRLPGFDVQTQVDVPAAESTASGTLRIAGWAREKGGAAIELVHVWALVPNSLAPVFLGAATLGDARPDVAAAFGPAFGHSGYHLDVAGLADGRYTLMVFAKAAGAPGFAPAFVVPITVTTPVPVVSANIDLPLAGVMSSGSFNVGGWALTQFASHTPGIEAIHIWALPVGGGTSRFLGVANLGGSRPDVATIFGSTYATTGFNLGVTNLPSGTWDIAVFIWPTGASTFTTTRVVRITVP